MALRAGVLEGEIEVEAEFFDSLMQQLDILASLEYITVHTPNTYPETQSEREYECVVCQDMIKVGDAMIELPCNTLHCFHPDCIRPWLRRRRSCPSCRAVV
jgi:hypothetical protein